MKKLLSIILASAVLFAAQNAAAQTPSETFRHYAAQKIPFAHKIKGQPNNLAEIKGLRVNHFTTSDNVNIAYWEAGEGEPLIFVPGWSVGGAMYVYIINELSKKYHVYVLEMRNHGLSQKTEYGNRIARLSMDVREFLQAKNIEQAYFSGHSMGAAVLWSYIDLFGTSAIKKIAFVDQGTALYTRYNWSEQERRETGAFTAFPDRATEILAGKAPLNKQFLLTDILEHVGEVKNDYYANVLALTNALEPADMNYLPLVMFSHLTNDWRDVIRHKLDIPVALFSGEKSEWLPAQKWIKQQVPNSKLIVYSAEEGGDHALMFKNPIRFARDLDAFLARK